MLGINMNLSIDIGTLRSFFFLRNNSFFLISERPGCCSCFALIHFFYSFVLNVYMSLQKPLTYTQYAYMFVLYA